MSTISVPLDKDAMHYLEHLEKNNPEMSRAGIVRKAIRRMSEEEAVEAVFQAQREIADGKVIREDAVPYLRRRMKKR